MVMSAIGLGATAGTSAAALAFRQDRPQAGHGAFQRRRAGVAARFWHNATNDVGILFAFLFLVHFFNNALIALTVGPLCSEAVPTTLMATASGLVIAVGELFGGGWHRCSSGMPRSVSASHMCCGCPSRPWSPVSCCVWRFRTSRRQGAAGFRGVSVMSNKVIISCAITGAMHTPTMSDALPITPAQIAAQSIEAAEAGAAIIHLHARNPADGEPTGSPEVYSQFLPQIHRQTDAVINLTTGGSPTMSVADRLGGRHPIQAGNVLAQHGLDEFRHFSGGESRQAMEIRLGGRLRPQQR